MIDGRRKVSHPLVVPTLGTVLHAAGDVVGGLLTIPLAVNYDSVEIRRLQLADDDELGIQFNLHLFHTAPSPALNDNDAFTLTAAQVANRVAVVLFDTWVDLGNASAAVVQPNPGLIASSLVNQRKLYGYLVNVGAYTPVLANALRLSMSLMEL